MLIMIREPPTKLAVAPNAATWSPVPSTNVIKNPTKENILPDALDLSVGNIVAEAVKKAAKQVDLVIES